MKIKEITYRSRRDFKAVFACEHCGYEEEKWGYDDAYFHGTVIPGMKCPKCGKKAGEGYQALTPKYPEWMVV